MVKMVLGSSSTQGSTMSSVAQARVAAYNQAISALTNFNGTGELTGAAYDSGKSYGMSTIIPLIKGALMYAESLGEAVPKLPSKYRAEVGGEDLDSAELERDIRGLESSLVGLRGVYRAMEKNDDVSPSSLQSISARMDDLTSEKNKKMEQLRKLNLFAGSSNAVFGGEDGIKSIDGLLGNIVTGINQVQTEFANFGGTFPSHSNDMKWAKNIEGEWTKKAEIDKNYQKVLKKLDDGKKLDEKDIKAIQAYQSRYPARDLPENVVKQVEEYIINNNLGIKPLQYGKGFNLEEFLYEKAGTLPEDLSKEAANGLLSDSIEETIKKKGAQKAVEKSAEIFANRYSIVLPNGKIMGMTPGATRAAQEAAEESINSTAKNMGKGLSLGVGMLFGIGIDVLSGTPVDEAVGSGIVTTAVSTIAEIGIASLVGVSALPLVATIGIGIGVGMLNEMARDAFPDFKKFEDNIGKAAVSGWDNMVNGVKEVFSW